MTEKKKGKKKSNGIKKLKVPIKAMDTKPSSTHLPDILIIIKECAGQNLSLFFRRYEVLNDEGL